MNVAKLLKCHRKTEILMQVQVQNCTFLQYLGKCFKLLSTATFLKAQ